MCLVAISQYSEVNWQEMALLTIVFVLTLWLATSVDILRKYSGEPLLAGQLKKRKLYILHGEGGFVANGEMERKVHFVMEGHKSQVKAVMLPVCLPEKTIGFWVTDNYDALGQRIFGEGAILIHPSNEKISFRWKIKSAKSDKK